MKQNSNQHDSKKQQNYFKRHDYIMPDDNTTKPDNTLKGRLKAVKKTRWIRFGIVSAVFFLWVVLMGNPWLGLLWFLLIDIYITGYIPFGWWKTKTGATRIVMSWVDAIVYALVLIYFIFGFIGQQYEIPSSSLEKSLLVGDRLWVDKTVYGSRVPQTPIHFPLVQHTFPLVNCKSYIESPQLEYHRMPGRRSVERGDIVVFNFPQGDTVMLNMQNRDYYQVIYEMERQGLTREEAKKKISSQPGMYGEIVWRPVDRRENYVKRTIGLPGERLRIKGDTVYINGKAIAEPENVEYNYIIPVSGPISAEKWHEIGVRAEDHQFNPIRNDYEGYWFYDVPLSKSMKAEVEKWHEVIAPLKRETDTGILDLSGVFPLGNTYGWTRPEMGEFWIPKRGTTLHLTANNLPLYERCIRVYEGNDLEVRDGKIYINGKQTDHYTFKMDYYWMMGDNRDRSLDSRYWGFVPEDHIVGSPVFIIMSLDQERGWTEGKMRWNRFLSSPNPDKSAGKW